MTFRQKLLLVSLLALSITGPFRRAEATPFPVQFEDESLAKVHGKTSGPRIDLILADPQSDHPRNAPLLLRRIPTGSLTVTPATLLKLLDGKTAQYDELPSDINEVIRTSQWFRQEGADGQSESVPAFVIDWPEKSVLLFVQTNVSDRRRYLHVFNVSLVTGKILHLRTEGFNGIKDLKMSPNGKLLSLTEYEDVSGGQPENQKYQRVVTFRTDRENPKPTPQHP